jgi:hypothetical protein
MAFFLSLVVSWSNPRLREKRLFFYLFKALGIYTKDFTLPTLAYCTTDERWLETTGDFVDFVPYIQKGEFEIHVYRDSHRRSGTALKLAA